MSRAVKIRNAGKAVQPAPDRRCRSPLRLCASLLFGRRRQDAAGGAKLLVVVKHGHVDRAS